MDNKTVERQKAKKRIKRKLLPSLLAGFSLPVTIFLYGPFDLFAQNRAEFAFTLYDFLLPCLIITLICGAVLSAIGLFLRRKAYSLYTALLFWATVMLYVQGSYLNLGYTSLSADGVTESAPLWLVIADAAVWALTLFAVISCVLKFKPVRKKLKTAVSLGLALVIFMEAVGTAAVSFEDGVYDTGEQMLSSETEGMGVKMLTTENLTTLSADKNVVVFLVDRFDAKYYRQIAAKRPELLSELEGFTYYNDHISLYPRTFPAVTYLLTGVENDFSQNRSDYFENAYENAEYLKHLDEQGYGINIYTTDYYAYENASCMDGYTKNVTTYTSYEIKDRAELVSSMIAFSLYRYFPFFLKGTVDNIGTDTFTRLVEFHGSEEYEKYVTDNKAVYEQLTAEEFTLTDESGKFTFLHIDGCHGPSSYDEDFNVLDEQSYDILGRAAQTFKIINRYLSEMKRLGVYEDATVIITGDHAAAITDTKPVGDARVTTLLVKPSGVSEGETVTSFAQTCQADIWSTIFASEGLEDHPECDGISLLDTDQSIERERRYLFQRLDGDDTEEIVYRITGDANVFSNWEIVDRRVIGRVYK